MTKTESTVIDQHIAKLRPESVLIAGAERKGHCVPAPHHPMFIAVADFWSIAHLPSNRWLVRGGLTQREAFERAMNLYSGGRDAGLRMLDPLPEQLAVLTPEEIEAMKPTARAYIDTLRRLLADTET
jgi:hypothetical protein